MPYRDGLDLVTPLSRLKTVAGSTLEGLAAALDASPLSQRRHRIAVTGLQRAGKTVFVTSFVHALLHAKDAPIEAFPFFPWRERVRSVELLDIPGLPRFPYAERLAELLAERPRDEVRGAPRGERHDELDRPVGISALGVRGAGDGERGKRGEKPAQQAACYDVQHQGFFGVWYGASFCNGFHTVS